MNKITLVTTPNPFNHSSKTIKKLNYNSVATLEGYLKESPIYDPKEHFLVVVNGKIVPKDQYGVTSLNKGSFISIVPRISMGGGGTGKSILSLVAGLALAYVSFGVGGIASGGLWGSAMATWTTGGMIAAAATMFVGGMLINRMTPRPKIDRGGSGGSDAEARSYTWGRLQPMQGQGNAVGITYGNVQAPTQILAQYVSVEGDKQYLNVLLCAGEGPLDKIENLKINDNPIENYQGVQVEYRMGTNTQKPISFFGDTYADFNLGYDLDSIGVWRTQLLNTNTTQGIEIQVELPSGLCRLDNEGKTQSGWVKIDAQYKKVGQGTWVDWVNGYQISDNKTSPIRRVIRVDNVEIGQYEVRVRCSAKSGTDRMKDVNSIRWVQVSSVLYDDFSRPNKALIGIRALATDQLSGGMPTITYEQTRSKVWVYNSYNGTYEEKPADNPAWACYDLIHYCRKYQNHRTNSWEFRNLGAPKEKMIYDDFLTWAKWCEKMDLKIDIFIETAGQLSSKLQDISIVGRGMVVQRGTKFGCICDMPTEPVMLFNMGNIVSGSFNESYLDLIERANEVELTFSNREKNWERDIVQVYSKSWDDDQSINNPTAITMEGITRWKQAYRQAVYLLKSSEYIVRTVSFDADVDAIACQVGDVVLVQHDLPRWGRGGRILGGVPSKLTLDEKILLEPGKVYEVRIQDSKTDDIVHREVKPVNQEIETDEIELLEPLDFVPTPYDDVYSFGEIDKSAKPFRIINITRSEEQKRTVTCLEYIPEIYEENYDFPTIDYSEQDGTIRNLTAINSFDEDGNYCVNISWTAPRIEIGKIRLSIDGKKYQDFDSAESFYRWKPDKWGNRVIQVSLFNNFGFEISKASINHFVDPPLPEKVQTFAVSFIGQNKQFVFDWSVPEGIIPIDGYEIRRGQSWEVAQPIKRINGKNIIRDTFIAVRGASTFWICAYNQYGYSQSATYCEIEVEQMPGQDIVEAIYDYEETGEISGYGELVGGTLVQWAGMTWDYLKDKTWDELKDGDWFNGTMGPVTATGKIVDIEKSSSVLVWIDEVWSVPSDRPNLWEYQASFDGESYSDWRPLPTSEIEGRFFVFRVSIQGIGRGGSLQSANLLIDVPENTVKIANEFIPAIGKYINFVPRFVKDPTIQITPNDEALIVKKTQISGDGCFVELFKGKNLVNNGVAEYVEEAVDGYADIFATGF